MRSSGWPYRAYQRLKLRVAPLLRGGIFSFEIHTPGIGFFAQLDWCAIVLEYCDRRGLRPQLSTTGPHYQDPERGPNWLSYFFAISNTLPLVDFRVGHISELCIPEKYLEGRTIERTGELVKRHLPLRDEIRSKLDAFCTEHFQGGAVLGVHFRGTDKTEEAPRVSWDLMRQTVSNYLEENKQVDRLFVASDEPPFIDHMRSAFPNLPVISSGSRFAANYRAPLGSDNYRKGEEALLDCLLLSRCSAVVRTTSFLSAWASIFNPKLPIVLVNRPFDDKLWYPEKALIPRSMNQYLPTA